MRLRASLLDLLRYTGKVVDFQTARKQIEESLESKQADSLQNANTQTLIKALLKQGITADELQAYIENS